MCLKRNLYQYKQGVGLHSGNQQKRVQWNENQCRITRRNGLHWSVLEEKYCIGINRVLDYTVETNRKGSKSTPNKTERDYTGVGLNGFYCNSIKYYAMQSSCGHRRIQDQTPPPSLPPSLKIYNHHFTLFSHLNQIEYI